MNYNELPDDVIEELERTRTEADPDPSEAKIGVEECRECGTELYEVSFRPESNVVDFAHMDENGNKNDWYAVEDTYSWFYHPEGTDMENPILCGYCRADIANSESGEKHHTVCDGEVFTVILEGSMNEKYVITEGLPWVDTMTDGLEDPLHEQRIAVLTGDTEDLEYDDEALIEYDLSLEQEEAIIEELHLGSPVTGVLDHGVGYLTIESIQYLNEMEVYQ